MEAIRQEQAGERDNWSWGQYIGIGLYYSELIHYYEKFDRRQIKVYLYDDLKENPAALVRDLYQFLEVDHNFLSDTRREYNVGGIPKSRMLHKSYMTKNNPIKSAIRPLLSTRLRKKVFQRLIVSNTSSPMLDPKKREELLPLFRADIVKLQNLIERDLSNWLD
jgi:hypothetical protein